MMGSANLAGPARAEAITPEQFKAVKARMTEMRAKRETDPEFIRQQRNEELRGAVDGFLARAAG